jgi:NAD(P)-dependent dehydrogenase (short-subunit alcohol dehydrogenase family)
MPDNEEADCARVAVVTGASRGIGMAVSEALRKADFCVIDAMRSPAPESSDSHRKHISLAVDVTDVASVDRFVAELQGHVSSVDVLVNCAGVMEPGDPTVDDTSPTTWDDVLGVNLRGPFLLCRALLPTISRSPDGRIVNITGGMGTFSSGMDDGRSVAYRVSKAGLNALTLTLAQELVDSAVTVCAVDPGWVRTDMGGPNAPRASWDAAADVLAAVLAPRRDVHGKLLREQSVVEW